MPNTISTYVQIVYAQAALEQLEKALGLANRVYRAPLQADLARERGETIQIRKPGTFSAQNAPSAAQNVVTSKVDVVLNLWKEVKFAVTDKELAIVSEPLIQEHIRPAAYALADNIDQALAALQSDVTVDSVVGTPVQTITDARQALFDASVPMEDLHLMVDGGLENSFLADAAFSQWQGAGAAGVETQMRGSLGMKFGFEVFANQNVPASIRGLAFRRNAFALAMARMPEVPSGAGAVSSVVTDPVTGLSLRIRTFYLGDTSTLYTALDVLYGVKTLDAAQAVRIVDSEDTTT